MLGVETAGLETDIAALPQQWQDCSHHSRMNNRCCQGVRTLCQAVPHQSRILWVDFYFPTLQRNQQWYAGVNFTDLQMDTAGDPQLGRG